MEHEISKDINNAFLLEAVLDYTRSAIVISDLEGTLLYINNFANKMYGLPKRNLSYKEWNDYFKVYHKDDDVPLKQEEQPLFRILNGEVIKDYEILVQIQNSGDRHHYLVNGTQIKDKNNEIFGALLITVDISNNKLIKRKLEENVENYRQLIEKNPAPIIIHRDGIILYVNPVALSTVGSKERKEMEGKSILEFLHPNSRQNAVEELYNSDDWHHLEYRQHTVLRVDGETRDVEFTSTKITYSGETAVITIGKDITEQNKAKKLLEESREQYRSLFEHHPDAVFMFDINGIFLCANEACEKVAGYKPEELIGKPFAPLLVEEDVERVISHFSKTLAGNSQNYECTIVSKYGNVVNINITNVPIVVAGKTCGIYGIAKDMTEQKRMQEEMKYLAYYDSLTNLPNRQMFMERVQELMDASKEKAKFFSILFIDLDRFKYINDTMGHGVGDQLLKEVASRLRSSIREEDMVCRFGGDEFVVLLNN